MPSLPPSSKVEATFRVFDGLDEAGLEAGDVRRPPSSLAGLKIVGDIVAPGIDEGDWSLGS